MQVVLATDLGGGLLAVGVEDVGEDDFGAFSGEEAAFGGALTAGSAGDESDFAIEPAHVECLLRVRC